MVTIINMGSEKEYSMVNLSKVCANLSLTDGACRVYSLLQDFTSNYLYTDAYVENALGISKQTLVRRKEELLKEDLISYLTLNRSVTILFIGSTGIRASKLKKNWEMNNGK